MAEGSPLAEGPYERLERATAGLQAPFALLDMDALWANAADLERLQEIERWLGQR